MKHLVLFIFALTVLIISCGQANSKETNISLDDPDKPTCPKGHHTDSIIPIIYGLPTAETFERADSGFVAIGGCELADENWWCKIHKVGFE